MHWTKYAANHEWPGKPEKFHLVTCAEVDLLERYQPRDGVVTSGDAEAEKQRPNLGYSDDRDGLLAQGFTPCKTCKP